MVELLSNSGNASHIKDYMCRKIGGGETMTDKADEKYGEMTADPAGMKRYKLSYWLTLAILLVMSAYPLINGVRMVYLGIMNGAVEPDQYAKYVIPYTALCIAVIFFAALRPVFDSIKRAPFWIGLAAAYAVFAGIEHFLERIRVNTAGMTLVDPAELSIDSGITIPSAAVDAWQASLCAVSPYVRQRSAAYASQNQYFYVMDDNTYKIHYYLISLIIIAMACNLIYGIGQAVRSVESGRRKQLIMQGMAAALLVSLCVFANTTAFFRQPGSIQTPLASVLTCLFFIFLGVSVGLYSGSFLTTKGKRPGLWFPVLLSVSAVVLMYAGEAVMMKGGLYRFGIGWFFRGIPGIILAPVDILVIIISGTVTWFVLAMARRFSGWPGTKTAIVAGAVCILISAAGIAAPAIQVSNDDGSILGTYEFDYCLYMNPFSSSAARKENMPYLYKLSEDGMDIINIITGEEQKFSAQYEKTAVDVYEFITKNISYTFKLPDLSVYRERWRLGVFKSESGQKYTLYQMDGEIWLVQNRDIGIWSIYRLKRTGG